MLTGYNYFNWNGHNGLEFDSTGYVNLARVTADGNGWNGVEGYSDGNIMVTCGSMNINGNLGWFLGSYGGTVTAKGLYAYGNGNPWNWDWFGWLFYYRNC